jgi:ADP-ribose pyrophosphatase YjhB (NUDIX family)
MNLKYQLVFKLKKIYWFFARPKRAGVKCVLESDGKVLMLRRTFGTDKWVFPGGAMRAGELPAAAVRREIQEDLGLPLEEVRDLGSFSQAVHHRQETIHCFAAPVPASAAAHVHFNKEKIQEVRWFDRNELPYLTPVSKSVGALYFK